MDYTLGSVAEARWNKNLCRFSAKSLPEPVLIYCQLRTLAPEAGISGREK